MDGRELKLFNERTMEAQFLRRENAFLRSDRNYLRVQLFHVDQLFSDLRNHNQQLVAQNQKLSRQVSELTAVLRESGKAGDAATVPAFVKPDKLPRRRKRPGRKAGHAAALRPMPEKIDVHQDVPLPADPQGRVSCPKCNACLLEVKEHERIVEDIIPEQVVVKCYHTQSGWCPGCRKVVESRHKEQPPASNLPHGQLGLNALATGVLLRITHRLPFRQISEIFADLPGLSVSPGAIAAQMQRVADWLAEDYQALKLQIRAAPQVYVDETGWRTDGKNGQLWGVTTPTQTLYHIDDSRGGKVVRELLGDSFGGTLVSDFYSAYATMDCKKQKCLTHLLREFKESGEKSPAFAEGLFYPQAKRLVQQMLLLKSRWDQMSDQRYTSAVCRLETRLEELASGDYAEPNEKRIAKRMSKHRKELTAFLWEKELDGTNNAAERALRPAVVARKISGGSRSEKGASAFARLASLLRTARQQGQNLLETIKGKLMAAWGEGNHQAAPNDA